MPGILRLGDEPLFRIEGELKLVGLVAMASRLGELGGVETAADLASLDGFSAASSSPSSSSASSFAFFFFPVYCGHKCKYLDKFL